MNYKVKYSNIVENDICETFEKADNINIFNSKTKAKNRLIKILQNEKFEIIERIKEIKNK